MDESSGCEVEPNTHKASWVMILSFLVPLLQSLGHQLGEGFWLLDSGASCSVINSSTLKRFDHGPIVPCSSTFTAANGTPVPFQGQTHVVLKVRLKDAPNGAKTGVFKIPNDGR